MKSKRFFQNFKRKIRNILSNDKNFTVEDYRKFGATIGDNCKFYNCKIDIGHAHLIEIGSNCTLTNCTLLSHDASPQIYFKKSKVGIIRLGNNVFIGWGAIILPNVRIGNNCIVGAGSVVTKDIPNNSVVCGNPCKIICSIDEFKRKTKESLKNKPVFDIHYKYKTKQQKEYEKAKLQNDYGYDE